MNLETLDYTLDPALVAQEPRPTRDGARLLIVDRGKGARAHAEIRELGQWLSPGDLLIVNDAEVMAARLRGRRPSGGAVEILLAEEVAGAEGWLCLARNGGKSRRGERITFGPDLEGTLSGPADGPYRTIRFEAQGDLKASLRRHGEVPLPPYIRRPAGPLPEDRERYQTVFARVPGAIAAPTAGLHFTPALLRELEESGVRCAAITLLVGVATFLPVRTASLDAHHVPAERYNIPASTAAAIAATKAAGGRVVAVGTTSVRTLESAALDDGTVRPGSGRTQLIIGPGYRFRVVDALLTNLHLPRSTLLALVAAFAGVEPTLSAYRVANDAGYRFYSYGDAMLIT